MLVLVGVCVAMGLGTAVAVLRKPLVVQSIGPKGPSTLVGVEVGSAIDAGPDSASLLKM